MKILVIGATGRVGLLLVEYALEEGHEVTAFARNIENYPISNPKLKTIKGDVLFPALIEAALPGHDAVVSVIGVRKYSGPITLLSRGVRNVVDSMERVGVKRIVTVTGAGILQEDEYNLIMETLSFPPNLQNISLDHHRVMNILQESQLNWTIVCPAFMHSGERSGEYLIERNHYPKKAQNQVSVENVADFILKELSEEKFLHTRVGIAQGL